MTSITTNFGIVHYEVVGRGQPILLLHGWLGSWGLWMETMNYLSKYYRTYALDFWGFGESGKKLSYYSIDTYVEMIKQFMDRLGIPPCPLIGHSMGGTVSLSVAIRYPHRASKVVVIGSPIVGSSLAAMLKMAGYRPIAYLVYHMMGLLKLGIRIFAPMITKDKNWVKMIDQDLSRTTLESFLMSIASLRNTDLRPYLNRLSLPVMGMYGERDVIVHPKQWRVLLDGVPHAKIQRFPEAGHFIMLDEPDKFLQTLRSFLDGEQTNLLV